MDLTDVYPKPFPPLFFRYWERGENGKKVFVHKFDYKFDGNTYKCPAKLLTDLLFAEYLFRYQAQLVDVMGKRLTEEASKEATPENEPDVTESGQAQLREIQQIYMERQRDLYLKECALPISNLAKSYWATRKNNPGWYLGGNMVTECEIIGGCCARGCGCCAKRLPDLPMVGMSGHCSLACVCCEKAHGYTVVGSERVASMDHQYKKALESDNPTFLMRIAHAYFHPQDASPRDVSPTVSSAETASADGDAQEKDIPPPPYKKPTGHPVKKLFMAKGHGK